MAAEKQNNNRALLMAVLLVLGLAFPTAVVYFAIEFVPRFKELGSGGSSAKYHQSDLYDPGAAWLQTRPIMIPDGHKGYLILRAYLRTNNRRAAEFICVHHPRLADEIQELLQDRPDIVEAAYYGETSANRFVQKALTERIGSDLFNNTLVSNGEKEMMAPTDTSRYECHKEGLRMVFRKKSRS
ncbi:hypothetical protein [Aestuariispira insulae]|uniref:Uncharacterized protein n=1 Tax=Aestuariispira insulae TaxID=1461337 RepID=A0A3D9HI92_9PROT|nr:hypothetical protein [Aestuariispira insulae]RED49154.1 hypothetical protein DFP90_106132 [Aestuariispira insulae]